jgi:hypothetical protein
MLRVSIMRLAAAIPIRAQWQTSGIRIERRRRKSAHVGAGDRYIKRAAHVPLASLENIGRLNFR